MRIVVPPVPKLYTARPIEIDVLNLRIFLIVQPSEKRHKTMGYSLLSDRAIEHPKQHPDFCPDRPIKPHYLFRKHRTLRAAQSAVSLPPLFFEIRMARHGLAGLVSS
jgi:hypothetical protein